MLENIDLREKLGVLENGKLKRAGALCFYRYPEKVISGCYVKIGKFEGTEIVYQDEVHGSLILIADRIIDLIYLKNLKAAVSYHKETRVETYPYARDALREAVFNALIHCNWAANVPVQIRVNEDTLSIANCSCLPMGWTAETIMGKHSSVPFNPDIARVFYRAGYIESWGRGIERICNACAALEAELLEYQVTGADTMVFFKALQSSIDLGGIPQVTPQVKASKETIIESKIVEFCSDARSFIEISRMFGYSDGKTVHKYLAPLIQQGRIARTIPDKPKSSKQKYITIK